MHRSNVSGPCLRLALVLATRAYAEALTTVLGSDPRIEIAGVATTSTAASALVRAQRPDIVLTDLPLARAGVLFGLSTSAPTRTRVVVCGLPPDEDLILAWAEAGAAGCVTASTTLAELIELVAGAAVQEIVCSRDVVQVLFGGMRSILHKRAAEHARSLTNRELEIARLVSVGLSNEEIALALTISVSTVKNHIHRILEKLHAQNRRDVGKWLNDTERASRAPRDEEVPAHANDDRPAYLV